MGLSNLNQRLILFFLACLAVAVLPMFFFWYLTASLLLLKAFVIICIIDFILKKSYRKKMGLILIPILSALLVAILTYYVKLKI
jgi:hypothetical protein